MKINTIKFIITLLFSITQFVSFSQENIILISGRIADKDTKEALIGVSILVKGTVSGTTTNSSGEFSLKTKLKFPFTLQFRSVGYQTSEIEVKSLSDKLHIELASQSILGQEVVVTASRVEESILKSPVAIEKLDIRAIRDAAAPSFYDALANLKGVQLTTSSLTFKVPNTRGFNIPNNFRFVQLVDGVDMQAATLGVPLGNAIGPTELDIESVEITPGVASALYGMSAINGLANLQTKSPFRYQGLSVYQKVGVNHVGGIPLDGNDHEPAVLRETAIRFAKAFNDKIAFKVNASFLKGTDWLSGTYTDQNPQNISSANPSFPELSGAYNPAYDGWNNYGDESNNRVAIAIPYQGKTQTFNVSRTGYTENQLRDTGVRNAKIDASIHYRLTEKIELSYGYRWGLMDGLFQRGNKIQLNGTTVQNHKIELKRSDFLVRAYALLENTGDSYNIKPLADNLDLNNGTNTQWSAKFKTALTTALDGGSSLADAFKTARAFADLGRVLPGTQAFTDLKNKIIGTNNWDIGSVIAGASPMGGAALWQSSRTYHADFQYDFADRIHWANVLAGADYRVYEVIPDGNNFVDLSKPIDKRTTADPDGSFGNNLYYRKYGAFVQGSKLLLNDKLKVTASARIDNNPEFTPKFNPRVALVYTLAEKHNFRASYQNGFRFPALFEALSYVNNGNVRRVGGLSRVNEGLGYLENSYTLASLNTFNAAVNTDVANGVSRNDAALKNRALLFKTDLAPTEPEHINSFEIGYKSVLFNNKISIDWDAYYNIYSGFLGQVEVAVPSSGTVGTDAAVLDMLTVNRAKQTRYRVYTNAKNDYTSYGSSMGITYNFYGKYVLSGNTTYNALKANDVADIFVTGFNTPKWATNLSISNREIIKNVGFNVVWKWQTTFQWESPLANGNVPAYHNIDAQVSLAMPKIKTRLKVGGSNIFNNRYIQYAAGPTIGGLYYVALTVDGN